jgi:hypothetical protein
MEYIQNPDVNLGLGSHKSESGWTVELRVIPKRNGGEVYESHGKGKDLREAIINAARQAFAIPENIVIVEESYYNKVRCLFYNYASIEYTGEYPWRLALAYSMLFYLLHKQMKTKARSFKTVILA